MDKSSPFALSPDWGMVPLRVIVGLVFLMHGYQKLFVFGIAGTTDVMAGIGVPAPQVAAILVTALELLGGLALIFGVFTRWAALLLAGDMAVAAMGPGGFSIDATRAAKSRSAAVL